jgi:signal transduction histidine kinase
MTQTSNSLSLSISRKILLGVVPFLLVSITASVLLHNYFEEQDMVNQAQASVKTYAEIIRESLVNMMVTNYEVDESYLARIHSIQGIDSLKILLNNLHLRPDLMTLSRIKRLELKRMATGVVDSLGRRVIASGEAAFVRDNDQFRAVVPFNATRACQQCHQVPLAYPIGAADIHISLSNISQAIESNWKRSFIIFVLFVITAIGIGTFAFRNVVARPVDALLYATKEIAAGKLDTRVPRPAALDELGILSLGLEDMRRSLVGTVKELAEKNKTLEASLDALHKAQDELIRSERLSTIGQMASSIIHDFRNPMAVVMSYADLLKRQPETTPEKRNQYYDIIVKAVQRMSDMTNDLLDYSRGQVKLDMQVVDVGLVVNDVQESVDLNLKKQHVMFEVQQKYHGSVRVDVEHFRRALINIINNAQEAMPAGGRIRLMVSRMNGFAEFSVSDTGVGIPQEIRDRIFEPFLTYGKERGTGLGLAITKRIVDAHQGKIELQSTLGEGTTFSLFIPL